MTLKQLIAELQKYEIKKIGVLRRTTEQNGKTYVTIYFTADKKVVWPHRLETIYPLVLATDADTQRVNKEAIKALKRALIADWDEE